ncbi:hypothetical protein C5167_009474 [Papaver somniferum]|uniref:Uncharacterized protein n=1 Tax=Papaver somniferum TaxID=3469 RepID=A0A4Y7K0E4_PAPSO|nr:hypothetical protein C5167_009474 [Papaver somniferum]
MKIRLVNGGKPFNSKAAEMCSKLLETISSSGEEENYIKIKFESFGCQVKYGPVMHVIAGIQQENVIGACFVGQDPTTQKMVMDKYTRIRGDYVAIVQHPYNLVLIPPIFMIDDFGCYWSVTIQCIN